MTKFWYSSLNSNLLSCLHLILSFDTTSLPCQASIIQRTDMDSSLAEEEEGEGAGVVPAILEQEDGIYMLGYRVPPSSGMKCVFFFFLS